MAARYGMHWRTVFHWAKQGGWKRRGERPLRDLPDAVRLLDAAIALEAQASAAAPESARGPGVEAGPSPIPLAAIESVERQVHAQLAIEESRSRVRGGRPPTRAEAAATARTLATHTQTLQTLAALRRGETSSGGTDDDDFAGDIDARRREVARRIHAFVEGRIGGRVGGADRPVDAERGRA